MNEGRNDRTNESWERDTLVTFGNPQDIIRWQSSTNSGEDWCHGHPEVCCWFCNTVCNRQLHAHYRHVFWCFLATLVGPPEEFRIFGPPWFDSCAEAQATIATCRWDWSTSSRANRDGCCYLEVAKFFLGKFSITNNGKKDGCQKLKSQEMTRNERWLFGAEGMFQHQLSDCTGEGAPNTFGAHDRRQLLSPGSMMARPWTSDPIEENWGGWDLSFFHSFVMSEDLRRFVILVDEFLLFQSDGYNPWLSSGTLREAALWWGTLEENPFELCQGWWRHELSSSTRDIQNWGKSGFNKLKTLA